MDDSFKGGAEPEDKVIVIVTATYNGRAPDSAVEVERALDAGAVRRRRLDRRALRGARHRQQPMAELPDLPQAHRRRDRGDWRARACCRAPKPTGRAISTARSPASCAICGRRSAAKLRPARPQSALSLTPVDAAGSCAPRRCPNMRSCSRSSPMTNWSGRPTDCGTSRRSRRVPRRASSASACPRASDYRTGDHIAVYARNRPELVDARDRRGSAWTARRSCGSTGRAGASATCRSAGR